MISNSRGNRLWELTPVRIKKRHSGFAIAHDECFSGENDDSQNQELSLVRNKHSHAQTDVSTSDLPEHEITHTSEHLGVCHWNYIKCFKWGKEVSFKGSLLQRYSINVLRLELRTETFWCINSQTDQSLCAWWAFYFKAHVLELSTFSRTTLQLCLLYKNKTIEKY